MNARAACLEIGTRKWKSNIPSNQEQPGTGMAWLAPSDTAAIVRVLTVPELIQLNVCQLSTWEWMHDTG